MLSWFNYAEYKNSQYSGYNLLYSTSITTNDPSVPFSWIRSLSILRVSTRSHLPQPIRLLARVGIYAISRRHCLFSRDMYTKHTHESDMHILPIAPI